MTDEGLSERGRRLYIAKYATKGGPWNFQPRSIDGVMQLHYHELVDASLHSNTMAATLNAESTLTDRFQTTVPEPVRRALGLEKRDKIKYTIGTNGQVVLSRAENVEGDDPILGQFLHFLAREIASSPGSLQAMDAQLIQHLRAMTSGVEIDLDTPLSPDDE